VEQSLVRELDLSGAGGGGGARRLGYTVRSEQELKMADTPSSDDLQQFSSDVSRRRLITAAATLAVAGTISPAAAQ